MLHKFSTSYEGEEIFVFANNPAEAVDKIELFFRAIYGLRIWAGLISWDYIKNEGIVYDN